jgi:hypothetical protein
VREAELVENPAHSLLDLVGGDGDDLLAPARMASASRAYWNSTGGAKTRETERVPAARG